MKREDLRSKIIPTTIENTDESQKKGNEKFNTTDLIYLDSYDEQYDGKKTDMERRISATDYAQMNNAYISKIYATRTGRQTAFPMLRSAHSGHAVDCVFGNGNIENMSTYFRDAGLCPSLHYNLPPNISILNMLHFLKWVKRDKSEGLEKLDIREVKDIDRKNYISHYSNW